MSSIARMQQAVTGAGIWRQISLSAHRIQCFQLVILLTLLASCTSPDQSANLLTHTPVPASTPTTMLARDSAHLTPVLSTPVLSRPQPFTPTLTPALPSVVSAIPDGKFLFIERISDITPEMQVILDFTAYNYTGDILVGTELPLPTLRESDLGYYGAQVRLNAPGEGGAGVIEIIRMIPLSDREGGLRLISIHEDGGVLLDINGKSIFVPPGGRVLLNERNDIGPQGDLVPGPRHIVDTFINHGFVERSKIDTR